MMTPNLVRKVVDSRFTILLQGGLSINRLEIILSLISFIVLYI